MDMLMRGSGLEKWETTFGTAAASGRKGSGILRASESSRASEKASQFPSSENSASLDPKVARRQAARSDQMLPVINQSANTNTLQNQIPNREADLK